MTRPLFRSFAVLALAVAGLVADGTSAQAQTYNFNNNYYYRPAFPLPYNFYNYQYMTFSTPTASYSQYQYSYGPYPTFLNNNYNNNYNYSPGYSSPSYGSMSGGFAPQYEPQSPYIDKQLSALKNAQRNSKWTSIDSGSKIDFDTWLADQSVRRDGGSSSQPALDIALINPNDEQLLSGNALNDLAAKILALEAKGKKAAPGLAAPELMEKIVFTGGPAADAINVFHASKLEYPEILKMPDFDMQVAALDKAYAPVVAALQAGKRVPIADIDRLQAAIDKARPATESMLKAASIQDAKALLAFFSSLESGLKYLKQPESVGVLGSKWNSIGVNVGDLVKHLNKYQIRFGRAANGDDAAYGSLHRGLLAYYAGLSQAK